MADQFDPAESKVSPVDLYGRPILPEVLIVANEIRERALSCAERVIGDPALASSLLEESAATVSRIVARQSVSGSPAIRNLEAYLFRSFLRRISRAKRKALLLAGPLPDEQNRALGYDPSQEFEQRLLVNELLNRCDAITRHMFDRRIEGFSWKEIGTEYGLSAHVAEAHVRRDMDRLRKKLGNGHRI